MHGGRVRKNWQMRLNALPRTKRHKHLLRFSENCHEDVEKFHTLLTTNRMSTLSQICPTEQVAIGIYTRDVSFESVS